MDDFSSPKVENTSTIDKLAWQLWSINGESVPIQDAEMRSEFDPFLRNGLLIEDTTGLRFSSNTVMIEAAARYFVFSNSANLSENPRSCFECLHNVWVKEIGKQESVSGHALAILHNLHGIDAFYWGQQAIEAGCNVFNLLSIFQSAIPLFSDASAASIVSFFAGHHEKVKNDLMGGRLFPNLDKWFAEHPHIAHEVRRLHMQDIREDSASVYRSALQGLALNDFSGGLDLIKEAAISKEPLVSGPAVHALGLIDFSEVSRSQALPDAVEVCRGIIETPSHSSLAAAVRTLGRLLAFDEGIASLLNQAGQKGDREALYALSEFLFLNEGTYGEREWFGGLLQLFAVTKPEHKGILSNIDVVLMRWIHADLHKRDALEFLDAWLSKQGDPKVEAGALRAAFPDTLAELVTQQELLNKTITNWLLRDDRRFPTATSGLVSHVRLADQGSVSLDRVTLDGLTGSELRFLVRRILGYLQGEKILIPLVFSMAFTLNAVQRSFGLIRGALLNYVGYDYPVQTVEYLRAQQNIPQQGEDIRKLCEEVIRELQSQMEILRELPGLKELQPPFIKVRRFQKERARHMNEAFEEASKNSIWRQIATQIPLKAGRRTFQALQGRYTDPMELKAFSHSVAIPRSEVIDPAGTARERGLFRMASRDDS
jgi:hypothetical protein